MSKLIQELLSFSRMEQMNVQKEFEVVNVSELLKIICEEQKEIHNGSISLATEIESGIRVLANQSLLARAYINLISNAYQYGKEKGHILVKLFRNGEKIVLQVKDDGIGISKENLEKIWHRFYRVDESRTVNESGSMGLGLSIVRWIAHYHSGEVFVESRFMQGSVFHFEFPERKEGI